jgi:methylphosphotriester-DNA--protein-cysteine methyltransferase
VEYVAASAGGTAARPPGSRDRRSARPAAVAALWIVGVTPKRLARIYRFAATVLAIDPAGPVDRLELAGRAGYYDQAHFGHDFRTFTGLTPTRYLDVRRRFLREHPGHPLDVGPLPAD